MTSVLYFWLQKNPGTNADMKVFYRASAVPVKSITLSGSINITHCCYSQQAGLFKQKLPLSACLLRHFIFLFDSIDLHK